jgi:hypothetical protein
MPEQTFEILLPHSTTHLHGAVIGCKLTLLGFEVLAVVTTNSAILPYINRRFGSTNFV